MDIVDLIIMIVRAIANRSKQRQAQRPAPLQSQQRQQALAAQIRALQQQAIRQQPGGVRGRMPVAPVRPGRPVGQRMAPVFGVRPVAPPPLPTKPAANRLSPPASMKPAPEIGPAPGRVRPRLPLKVPLILGEVLGPPVALREPEF